MAFPSDTLARIVLSGNLGTSEIFSTGWWVSLATVTQASMQALSDAVAAYLQTTGNFTASRSVLATDSAYTRVTTYGYQGGSTKAIAEGTTALTGLVGTATNPVPNQVSLVVSTRTARPGRSYRGRIYLPANGAPVSTGHVITTTISGNVATEWANTLKRSGNAAGGSVTPVIVSAKAGVFTGVTQVIVDQKLDIQRRRADRQGSGTPSVVNLPST